MATGILDRTFEGPVPNAAPVAAHPRRASAYSGLLIAALLSVLYAYRRRRYIAEWIGAWVLLSFGMFIISGGYASLDHARLAVTALELSKVAATLLLFRSAHSFARTTPYSSNHWMLVPGLAAWFYFAAAGRFSVPVVLAPAFLLTGLIDTRTAMLYASAFRRRKMLGALLIAVTLTVIGITNLAFGIFFERVLTSGQLLLFFLTSNSLCFLVAAFGMHLLVFEEITHELGAANSELREAHGEMRRMANVDVLTGCYNRRFFEENIDRELQRHRRYGTPLSVLFIDIDRFKSINDSYGHDVGDRVLQYVGDFLRRKIREADYVVRWGGDEFLVLMTCKGAEAAAKVKVLKQAFDEALDTNALPPGSSLSIGYAEIPPDAAAIVPFIRLADQSMYMDKIGGA